MKKMLVLLLVVLMAAMPLAASAEAVQLTMASWRNDDAVKVQQLLDVYNEKTGVQITFQPTQSSQYNSVLRLQLDAGTGADLMYARSYETGRELFDAGFLMDCTDIPGVKENFTDSSLDPWRTSDGKMFAVPFAAVSQVIYYNKAMFEQAGCAVPTTWEEFLTVCQKLKDAGFTPLANGLASEWDILECVFLGMLPNYVGGLEERVKYESGEKAMNDADMVAAYTAIQAIAPFLPEGYASISNDDANMVFATEQSAMLMDGSWSCGNFDEYGLSWGVFAFPAPEGKAAALCFHPDMAITGNTKTQHPEEVKAFLAWIASPEGAQITADYLPAGFFPMINAPITFQNEHVNEILQLNEGRITDARFIWPKMMNLYTPMLEQLNALVRGETQPQAAADAIAAIWPAK